MPPNNRQFLKKHNNRIRRNSRTYNNIVNTLKRKEKNRRLRARTRAKGTRKRARLSK
jgi:hypothetical protein